MSAMTEQHVAMLKFETEKPVWRYAGAREAAIRRDFGVSAVRYYQVLDWLIDQPDALAYAPSTVRRLQRLRQLRRDVRAARQRA